MITCRPVKLAPLISKPSLQKPSVFHVGMTKKKADWALFKTLTDTYTKPVNTRQKNVNRVVERLHSSHSESSCRERSKRCPQRLYKPYWTEQLQNLESQVSKARDEAETNPSVEKNIALKERNKHAPFLRGKAGKRRPKV